MDAVVVVVAALALAVVGGYFGGWVGWREGRGSWLKWHWPKRPKPLSVEPAEGVYLGGGGEDDGAVGGVAEDGDALAAVAGGVSRAADIEQVRTEDAAADGTGPGDSPPAGGPTG